MWDEGTCSASLLSFEKTLPSVTYVTMSVWLSYPVKCVYFVHGSPIRNVLECWGLITCPVTELFPYLRDPLSLKTPFSFWTYLVFDRGYLERQSLFLSLTRSRCSQPHYRFSLFSVVGGTACGKGLQVSTLFCWIRFDRHGIDSGSFYSSTYNYVRVPRYHTIERGRDLWWDPSSFSFLQRKSFFFFFFFGVLYTWN